jgi:ligand-binding SRPBCC domain-containing protein
VAEVDFSVVIDAPPEDVWAVVADPRNLSHWDRHVAAVEGVPPEGLSEGIEYLAVMRFMGVRATLRCRAIEWEPPTWAVFTLSGIVDATVTTRIERLPLARSRLRHDVDYHFRRSPIGELAAQSIELFGGAYFALRHGTLVQKRQIERLSKL